jgi:uncharacterized repeat protein (TIGR04076 family)
VKKKVNKMSKEKKEIEPTGYEWLKEKAIDKTFWNLPPFAWELTVKDLAESTKYLVEAKVVEILGRGACPYGHKPGDTFIFDGDSYEVVKSSAPAGGFCMRAMTKIFPFGLMMPGPSLGRGEEDSLASVDACPEAMNPVIFQLKRIKKTKQTSKAPWVLKKKGKQ